MAMASDYWKVVGDAFCNVLVGFTEPENDSLCNTNTFLIEFEALIRRVTSDEADRLLDDDVIPREIVNTSSIELDDSDSSYMNSALSKTLQQLQVPLEERSFMVENIMSKASKATREETSSPYAGGKRLCMKVNIDMYVIDDDDVDVDVDGGGMIVD